MGTAISRELSSYKLKIALLEKEEELAFGVSKSNSGIIHPGTQNRPGSLKGRLCLQGNALIREISRDLGVEFKEIGELIVVFSQEEVSRLLQLKQEAEILGVSGLEVVDQAWLKEHEPNLSREIVAALYAPTAGIISPYRLAYALSENAVLNGLEIYTQSLVQNILVMTPVRHFGSTSLFEITTERNTFQTNYIINAAGLYADEISQMVGINNFQIRPRKGEEFLLDKKQQDLTNHLIFPLPTKISKGVIVIKTFAGNPMIGPTAEDVENKEDLSTSEQGLEKVIRMAQRMVPSIDKKDIIAYFAGLRPVADDDFIIRCEDKVPGFVNVAGIQSPGLTAAPAIAQLVGRILKQNGLVMEKKKDFYRQRKKTVHLSNLAFSQAKELIQTDRSFGDIVCRCEMVSAGEIREAIRQGAVTLDGIKFRTQAQAGRCHGGFCTTRIMKILAQETNRPLTAITKRGRGSEIVKEDRADDD